MPNISPQTLPASLRSIPTPPEERSLLKAERRPYIVPVRKPATSTRKYLSLFPHESEDARLTGATRSLYRRLLALNLPRPVAQEVPVAVREIARETREMRVTVIEPKTA